MSQSDKLEQKLRAKPKPVSFPWDDLVTLMKQYGFTVLTRKAKGSHFTFYHPETRLKVKLSRSHPDDVLKGYQIANAIDAIDQVKRDKESS